MPAMLGRAIFSRRTTSRLHGCRAKGEPVAFKFQEASCVVVGTFNIYIIRPDWLGKLGLIPEGAIGKIERPLDQPGMRLSFAG